MPRLSPAARGERVEARRSAITAAAIGVFSEKGFRGATIEEIADAAGVAAGTVYLYFRSKRELLVQAWQQVAVQSLVPLLSEGEMTPEARIEAIVRNRVNLITEAPPEAESVPDYPLVLMSLSTDRAQSSQWSVELDGPAEVTVNPEAASGIPDGAICRLESRISSLVVRLRHDPAQRRDVALIPKGGHLHDGRCANALIRARTTDLGEGGALYDERVRLVART